MEDAVLAEETLCLINAVRKATGLDELYDLPKGYKGQANACLLAEGLNWSSTSSVSVYGGSIDFKNHDIAKKAAIALGIPGPLPGKSKVTIPKGHTFGTLVSRFDGKQSKYLGRYVKK